MRHFKGVPKPKTGDRPLELGDPEYKERNIRILQMKEFGFTSRFIGKVYGISGERVRQIIIMETKNIENGYRATAPREIKK